MRINYTARKIILSNIILSEKKNDILEEHMVLFLQNSKTKLNNTLFKNDFKRQGNTNL